jgi:adenosine deaminase
MTDLTNFIAGMPKCELHLHLEGTLEPEMKFALAKRNGIALPYKDAAAMRAAYDFHDLPSFLKIYYEGMGVLVHEPDFYDLTFAYLAKAHAQNVRYAEMFFDPQPHTGRGVAFDVIVRGIRRAQMDAERIFGIKSQLIMCFLRDWSAEFAMTTLVQALPYRDWIVGVGLDSDEKNNPPVKFKAVFERARAEGFLLTMHCDVDQHNTTEHIRQVIEDIGVNRIDHGVNVLDSQKLIDEVAKRQLALTICPVSNAFVTNGSKAGEIKRMLDLGIRATVHSDDPAYFGGYIAENFACVHKEAGLGKEALVQLSRNAFDATWLPRALKDGYLTELEAYARQ